MSNLSANISKLTYHKRVKFGGKNQSSELYGATAHTAYRTNGDAGNGFANSAT